MPFLSAMLQAPLCGYEYMSITGGYEYMSIMLWYYWCRSAGPEVGIAGADLLEVHTIFYSMLTYYKRL